VARKTVIGQADRVDSLKTKKKRGVSKRFINALGYAGLRAEAAFSLFSTYICSERGAYCLGCQRHSEPCSLWKSSFLKLRLYGNAHRIFSAFT